MAPLSNMRHERLVREYLRNGGNGTQAYAAIYGRNGQCRSPCIKNIEKG
jgi:hypothetical protein